MSPNQHPQNFHRVASLAFCEGSDNVCTVGFAESEIVSVSDSVGRSPLGVGHAWDAQYTSPASHFHTHSRREARFHALNSTVAPALAKLPNAKAPQC